MTVSGEDESDDLSSYAGIAFFGLSWIAWALKSLFRVNLLDQIQAFSSLVSFFSENRLSQCSTIRPAV
jgi:hypothetical protein